MTRGFVFFIFVHLSFLKVAGQKTELDRVHDYLDRAQYHEAISLCDSAVNAPSLKDQWYLFHARKADALYYLGDIKTSLQSYLDAASHEEILLPQNSVPLQECYSYIGFCYRELGHDIKAEDYFRKSLRLALTNEDSVEIAICYYNISTAMIKMGALDSAINMLNKAYEIDLVRKDTAAIGFDLKTMGDAHLAAGSPSTSLPFYRESIFFLKRSTGNKNSLGMRYNSLAEAFIKLGSWDSASYYTKLSIAEHKSIYDSVNLASRWINMCIILTQSGSPEQGLVWGNRAKVFFEDYETGEIHVAIYDGLIEAYIKLSYLDDALNLVGKNIDLCQRLGLVIKCEKAYRTQSKILLLMEDYQGALKAMEQSSWMKDSVRLLESERMVDQMRVRFEVDKIASENKLLEAESKITQLRTQKLKIQLFWSVFIAIIIILSIGMLYFFRVKKARAERLAQESQYDALQKRFIEILKGPQSFELKEDLEDLNVKLVNPLTEREYDSLSLSLKGLTNREIAEKLFVSESTIKFHLRNVYNKLGVSNRKEALEYVVKTS
ncbi:MAG: tetratricopeptide repeat protein [Cyclobacteriaceae bacterium]